MRWPERANVEGRKHEDTEQKKLSRNSRSDPDSTRMFSTEDYSALPSTGTDPPCHQFHRRVPGLRSICVVPPRTLSRQLIQRQGCRSNSRAPAYLPKERGKSNLRFRLSNLR